MLMLGSRGKVLAPRGVLVGEEEVVVVVGGALSDREGIEASLREEMRGLGCCSGRPLDEVGLSRDRTSCALPTLMVRADRVP